MPPVSAVEQKPIIPWKRFTDSRLWLKLQNLGTHFLASLEFHHGPGGDRHIRFGVFWVAPDARLAGYYIEHPEITQLHLVAFGKRLRDVIQGFLHHIEHLALNQPGFLADAYDEITFG